MESASEKIETQRRLKVSVVMPTLNSERTLRRSLESIARQKYEGEVEIVIADGGSTDCTREIATEFGCIIVENPGRTGEAGKAMGYKAASGDIIALIDSDNILVSDYWLARMTAPFDDENIAGSEPIMFEYRKSDSALTKYCSLMGLGDPLCYFMKNYDHINMLSGTWTGLDIQTINRDDYLEVLLEKGKPIPTMGANGFLVRKELLDLLGVQEYLFDIDIIGKLIERGFCHYAKVNIGIVHIYGTGLGVFARKQLRRVRDFNYYKNLGMRSYPWEKQTTFGVMRFILYTILTIPLVVQAAKGFRNQRDIAWFLHIPACWITLVIYVFGYLEAFIKPREQRRDNWSQ